MQKSAAIRSLKKLKSKSASAAVGKVRNGSAVIKAARKVRIDPLTYYQSEIDWFDGDGSVLELPGHAGSRKGGRVPDLTSRKGRSS